MDHFDATIFCAVLLGFGCEHMRIRYVLWRKKQARRQFLGASHRKDPEPQWASWTAEIGKAMRR